MSYPTYAASLFAGNDLCRSAFAFAAILFARPMFLRLGIGKGVSLLAGLSVLGIVSFFFTLVLWHWMGVRVKTLNLFMSCLGGNVAAVPLRCEFESEVEVCAEIGGFDVRCEGSSHVPFLTPTRLPIEMNTLIDC